MSLEYFEADANTEDIVAALRRDGAVVLHGWASAELADNVAAELRPYFDSERTLSQSEFNGFKTLRVAGILARSRSSAELIGHPRLLEILDPILLPHCIQYQIGSTTGIEIHPGEDAQRLHTDDVVYPLRFPGLEWQVSANWALDDFNVENGTTRLVPGSHKCVELLHLEEHKVVQVDAPKGSAIVYLGSVLHGGGANRSDRPRMGLVITYSLGWLRQEENQYLTIPREIADSYPEPIRRLMGYQGHGRLLGWYPDNPDGY